MVQQLTLKALAEQAGCSESLLSKVEGGHATFPHPAKSMSRTYCASCGEIVCGTNRFGMRVVSNSLAARAHGGQLPGDLQPTMHLFYRHRVIDVVDALPKFLDGWDGPTLDDAN